jgi:uncharacterized membrane protein
MTKPSQISARQISFAAAAALIAISATASAPAFAAHGVAKEIACYGVNSCKGTSDCKSGNHDCKGQNDCKGQGFKHMTKSACVKAGGSLMAPK